jgi:hypothetical protein
VTMGRPGANHPRRVAPHDIAAKTDRATASWPPICRAERRFGLARSAGQSGDDTQLTGLVDRRDRLGAFIPEEADHGEEGED